MDKISNIIMLVGIKSVGHKIRTIRFILIKKHIKYFNLNKKCNTGQKPVLFG